MFLYSPLTSANITTPTLLSILDLHLRRPQDQSRVVGALLGKRGDSGLVEITSTFPIPLTITTDNVSFYSKVLLI
jgi:hypothetical protein